MQIFASMIFASAINSARCSAKLADRARAKGFGRYQAASAALWRPYYAYDYGYPYSARRQVPSGQGTAAKGSAGGGRWADSALGSQRIAATAPIIESIAEHNLSIPLPPLPVWAACCHSGVTLINLGNLVRS